MEFGRCSTCAGDKRLGPSGRCLSCVMIAKWEQKLGTPTDRFWAHVDKQASCWVWTGSLNAQTGYGVMSVRGTAVYAHRFSFEMHHGATTLDVCHRCDNPPCVNPAHLYAGTAADNLADMRQRERSTFGERNRHAKLTEADVLDILAAVRRGECQSELGRRYGVTPSAVCHIARGHSWAYLQRHT